MSPLSSSRLARIARFAFAASAALAAAAVVTSGAATAVAQGSLSVQGFGYPGGQLSTRALATGGSLADFDPQSPINPAALSLGQRSAVYVQYDPEFRSQTIAGSSISNTTARFPLFTASGRYNNLTFGLAISNYLDRSWTNVYTDTQVVNGEKIASKLTTGSTGGISDIRFAASYSFGTRFHVGAGVHFYPGENRVLVGRDFDSTLKAGGFSQATTLTYSGTAFSVGFVATPVLHVNIGGSARIGQAMHVRLGDSTMLGSGKVPTRFGASLAFDGITGSLFSVRWSNEKWSDLKGLGSSTLPLHDATELAAGVEVAGPKISGVPMGVRFGWRQRDLPFSAGPTVVKEQGYTGGLGIPLGNGRAALDLGVQFARRTQGAISEKGTIVSVGFSIRP
jgi:hypothetical protein